jgi:hypothetical protein
MTNEMMGYKFELWMKNLFEDLGEHKVKHDVTLKDEKRKITAQFDVTYGFFSTYYVECKYRSKNHVVKFSEIATFAGKLKLFDISYKKGVFVTNSFYEKRALAYAKELDIKTFDGNQIYNMYNSRKWFNFSFGKKDSLENLIRKYKI